MAEITRQALRNNARATAAWTIVSAVFAAFYLSLYPAIGGIEELEAIIEAMPPAFVALFGGETASLSTVTGYLRLELFSFVLPLLVFALVLTAGGNATAGEEESGTLELLLANPVPRWRVVVEKFLALAISAAILLGGVWAALALTAIVMGIEVAFDVLAAGVVSAGFLGLALGGLALLVGALTGSRMLSIASGLAVGVAGLFVDGLAPLVEGLEPWRVISPHYHYIGYDPLLNGLHAGHAAVLLGAAALLVAGSVAVFERRDLAS